MLVEELMTTDVVTVSLEADLDEVVGELLANDVGSVVVVEDGRPTGLVTETDALEAALASGDQLDDIAVEDLAHRPVVTTQPGQTVQRVARRMADEDVKKVPVVDGLDLVGIVTLTDVVWHLSDLRKEASALEAARDQWENED